MKKNRAMKKIKELSNLLVIFAVVLLYFSAVAIACPPPQCNPCYIWNGEECVCGPNGTSCGSSCKECRNCSCVYKSGNDCENDEDCTGECETCENCKCVDDDSECSSSACEECNNGVCEDSCPPLGLYCEFGECVECRDIFDCDLCEQCVSNECVHPCDECYYPGYCGSACACVECYPGQEDTATCSSEKSTTECDCSVNVWNPCGGQEESVVYSGATLTSCTGPDCHDDGPDVLCYTTYQTCKTSSIYKPLLWCVACDSGPPPPAPWPKSCTLSTDIPGPGCWNCVNTYESGIPKNDACVKSLLRLLC